MRSRKRPEKITYFVDRSLGNKHVANDLLSAGEIVEVHDEHFAQNAPDEEWLPFVGKKKWVVLTKDIRIRYLLKWAVEKAKVRVFILVAKDLRGDQMAKAFSLAIRRIERMARKHHAPFIAKVYRDGKILMWTDFKE